MYALKNKWVDLYLFFVIIVFCNEIIDEDEEDEKYSKTSF
jgi:hypothetical protein